MLTSLDSYMEDEHGRFGWMRCEPHLHKHPTPSLDRQDVFFGERTTARRVYMRGLTHMHEHMGQLIAYTGAVGMSAPWPDWRESGRKIIERGQAALRK
jgi:hypothetical protein